MARLIKARETDTPTATYELITPGSAQTYLDTAAPNRNLRFVRIEQYEAMMRRGDWLQSGQGIIFDEKGRLLDGQHRLHAIIRADIPVLMLVVRNVRDVAQLVMDQGAKRALHDQIKLREGFDCLPIHAGVAKAMFMSVGGPNTKERERTVTDIQLMNSYYVKHHKAIEFAVGNFWHSTIKGVTVAPVFAPLARAFYTQDTEQLTRFGHIVNTGMSTEGITGKDTAAVVLRNWLLARREQGKGARNGQERFTIYKKTEIALSAFLEGKSIQRLGQMQLEQELFPIPGDAKAK
jgi:hypothetical protein